MDWYSWLSKTNLDPTLVHDYGLAFIRNELQEEDLTFFNHEFLQSIGITVAKHRLEILKLARKDELRRTSTSRLSRLVLAVNKTRKLITRNISKLGSHKKSYHDHESPHRNHWSGALRRINVNIGAKRNYQQDQKAVMVSSRNMMWSGPLDKDKFMVATKSHLSVSGPLDGKMQEQFVYPNWSPMVPCRPAERSGFICRSPTVSGPIERLGLSPQVSYYNSGKIVDHDEVQSLWSLMFQGMKPT